LIFALPVEKAGRAFWWAKKFAFV